MALGGGGGGSSCLQHTDGCRWLAESGALCRAQHKLAGPWMVGGDWGGWGLGADKGKLIQRVL